MVHSTRKLFDHIVGHKGAGFSYPENTLGAFNQAAKIGLKRTEFDVRLTLDGIVVLSNKDSLLNKSIAKNTYKFLSETNIAPPPEIRTIPLLDDALTLIKKLNLYPQIELKAHPSNWPSLAEETARIVDMHYSSEEMAKNVLVTSFSSECLSDFRKHANRAYKTGLLIHSELTENWKNTAADHNFDYIHIFGRHITSQLAQDIKGAGYHLNAYKVMDRNMADDLIQKGVERFTTDTPEKILEQYTEP